MGKDDKTLHLMKMLEDLCNVATAWHDKDPKHPISVSKWHGKLKLTVGVDSQWFCCINNVSAAAEYPGLAICKAIIEAVEKNVAINERK